MVGQRLEQKLSRLVHGRTYERVVAPAIADLQFEAPSASAWSRVEGYWAVCRALAGGVALDLRSDIRDLAGEASLLGKLACLQVASQGFPLALALDRMSVIHGVLLAVGIFVMSLGGMLICFWPPRDPHTPADEPQARFGAADARTR